MFAVAGKEEKTGDIIIKVCNPTKTAYATDMKINGAGKVAAKGTEIVMTSADPWDENSFENPTKVSPVTREISGLSSAFKYTFKPYSLTVLRLKTK
jgi:alpha-L-arabinofuranosidase